MAAKQNSKQESTADDVALGGEWAVTVEKDVREVVFLNPEGRAYTVRSKADGHGLRVARLALNVPGEWTAADGAFAAAVKK